MLKNKAYKDVSEEIEHIKKARKKFEQQMQDVEDMKTAILKVAKATTVTIKILEKNEEEISFHRKALIDTIQRLESLEKKGEPSEDVMIG